MRKPSITVIGSINMDMITESTLVPEQGETILGTNFSTIPGGKGANQAVASARLGADVRMIGRVGDDTFGPHLQQSLATNGINCDRVKPVTECSSGVATILLTDNDNRIIVVPGANKHVTIDYVDTFKQDIVTSDLVLLQLEIPLETVKHILELCSTHKVPVILNPAPAQKLEHDTLAMATYITPNESEQRELFGDKPLQEQALREKLIVTRGKEGASFYADDHEIFIKGYPVKSVDTTGAGDTFNGALAVALASGEPTEKAIKFANAAAALSVQKFGAQAGMPNQEQVAAIIKDSQN
ncbi:ribokinase [Salipaludibacillus sp. HK11]|uniref:ribokinase n=1 Tax=Salipaludibacillus sp. HK11 TaxID=3394320 RepID=UPI0039FBB1CC